jgi:hypothetical protein
MVYRTIKFYSVWPVFEPSFFDSLWLVSTLTLQKLITNFLWYKVDPISQSGYGRPRASESIFSNFKKLRLSRTIKTDPFRVRKGAYPPHTFFEEGAAYNKKLQTANVVNFNL